MKARKTAGEKEKRIFRAYIRARNLRRSAQREEILDTFLRSERHLTADELYRMVTKKYPSIGYATVYRTMRLLCECGLCRELKLEDGTSRYEHLFEHGHHDHIICLKCGRFIEVVSREIEKIQNELARKHGFLLKRHRMELYGICGSCRGKNGSGRRVRR